MISTSSFRFAILLVLASLFVDCHKNSNPVQPEPSQYVQDFDSLWTHFDRDYAYFDYKHIDWQANYATYRPRAEAATSMDELVTVFQTMLSPLRDEHVWLVRPDSTLIRTYDPPYLLNYDLNVLAQYSNKYGGQQMSSGWGAYWRIDSIPYIQMTTWYPPQVNTSEFDAALELYKNSPGLILDVRMNRGGGDPVAYQVAGRFTTVPFTSGYYQLRNGPHHADLTVLIPLGINPTGAWQYQKPVVLLVGRMCFSANEDFISAMREIPNVTVIGDTTGGGDGNPEVLPLSHNWMYTVSRWIAYTADKKVIEWNGIPPDICVQVSAADFAAGKDPVLEYGLKTLREKIAK